MIPVVFPPLPGCCAVCHPVLKVYPFTEPHGGSLGRFFPLAWTGSCPLGGCGGVLVALELLSLPFPFGARGVVAVGLSSGRVPMALASSVYGRV